MKEDNDKKTTEKSKGLIKILLKKIQNVINAVVALLLGCATSRLYSLALSSKL